MKLAGTHVLFIMDENAAMHAAMLGGASTQRWVQ
jgi:hypothetical protein